MSRSSKAGRKGEECRVRGRGMMDGGRVMNSEGEMRCEGRGMKGEGEG